MASWGLKDNVTLSGNVTTSNASPVVQGFGGSLFKMEVNDGDYLAIAGHKYQIHNVMSNVALILTANAATNSANVKAYAQKGPKFVANVGVEQNAYSIQRIIGLDLDEAKVPSSKAKGLKTQGWNHFITYTDAHGDTRFKAECLVALSKLFDSANVSDYADDSTVLDQYIYFASEPSDQSKAANSNVTLRVSVLSAPAGASPSYQWKSSPNNIVFANISNGGVFTGATTNTLQISNIANLDANYFQVVVSGTGLDTITSNAIIIEHL